MPPRCPLLRLSRRLHARAGMSLTKVGRSVDRQDRPAGLMINPLTAVGPSDIDFSKKGYVREAGCQPRRDRVGSGRKRSCVSNLEARDAMNVAAEPPPGLVTAQRLAIEVAEAACE